MADLSGTIGVVIADDHEMVRSGLERLFGTIHRAHVIGMAADGLEAIALCRKLRPGLMTLDVGMPLANGAEVFAECRRWSPETKVAVFTGFTSVSMLADWVASGVDGLFLKTCGEEELRAGLELVLSGQKYVAGDIVRRLEDSPPPPDLTLREREVLSLIAEGLTSTQIGDKLAISPKTVEKHRATLFEKFGAPSVAGLLTAAFRTGLLDHLNQT
ncbi:response regulator [Henriciella pelagia]|nr:response regulator transcription factor [Henriciella pelagia]